MIALTVIGLGVAGYLTYVHYSGTRPACTLGTACIKVQTSVWSKVDGFPVALMGLIGYVLIFFSLLAPDRDETRMLTVGLTLFGVCFSGYLTYRELFSIHAICEWCATSAAILTVMAPLSIWRFLRDAPTLPTPGASHSLEGVPAGSTAPLGTLPYR